MESKTGLFVLYKTFVDAYMKAHPTLTRSTCHFNSQIEWNKVKTDERLVKETIDKYLSMCPKPSEQADNKTTLTQQSISATTGTANERKRTLSSDDEYDPYDSDLETEKVTPVEPTFSKRDQQRNDDFNDESKPWVRLSLERARARAEAQLAKIEARRLARESRIRTPVQEGVEQELKEISERIDSLMQVKNMGLSTSESSLTLKKLLEQKKDRIAALRSLKSKQRAAMNYRIRKKRYMETLCAADPEVAAQLLRVYAPTMIRAQIDNICPDLIQTFEEIARICGALDGNPRLVNTGPCFSLDELRNKIKIRGYEIRRTLNFYRLISTQMFREDGKRHSTSTPVRLRKLMNIERTPHSDCFFVEAILRHVKDLAGSFGNDCVFYVIEDRKASVRIGRSESRGHAPLILRLDYQSSSVDSIPIPANTGCQLKPIVYASCLIDETGVVTNEGPTYISIRSIKHEKITNEHEDIDLDYALKSREFERTARNHIGVIKPIIVMGVDSLDPYDFTRYPKTLATAIARFKKYNLDALFMFSQAPGQSSFNITERRLAILSHDLPGLVLPHDYFGTHLNTQGYTIDAELEKQNIKKTGEVLADIWSMDKIDGHTVVARYLEPPTKVDEMIRTVDVRLTINHLIDLVCDEEEDISLNQRMKRIESIPPIIIEPENKVSPKCHIDEYWCATHVFQTQYTIQIVRCTRLECCGPWRSNYGQVFPHRFLPPPVPFNRSSAGVRLVDLESSFADRNSKSPYYGTLFQRIQFHGIVVQGTKNTLLPYDAFCPSVQNDLQSRTCSICKQYIPLPMRLRNHYRVHQQRYASTNKGVEGKKEEDIYEGIDPIDQNEIPKTQINPAEKSVFLFSDMVDWLKSDFEEMPTTNTKPKSTASIANAMIRKEKQLAAQMEAENVETGTANASANSVSDSMPATSETQSSQNQQNDVVEEIKIDDDVKSVTSIKKEAENLADSVESLVFVDEDTRSSTISNDTFLEQYDDLNDLLDKM